MVEVTIKLSRFESIVLVFINGMFEFQIIKNTKSWNRIWYQNSYTGYWISGKSMAKYSNQNSPIWESRDLWNPL